MQLASASRKFEVFCKGLVTFMPYPLPNQDAIEAFWETYQNTLPERHPHRFFATPDAWAFGNSVEMANKLGRLVFNGIKTATCCRYLGENIAEDIGVSIIHDGIGAPICLVEPYEITVKPYNMVDAQFAFDEGEGDRSLEYWQRVHWEFFTCEAQTEGYEVSEDMLLMCERFRVLYP